MEELRTVDAKRELATERATVSRSKIFVSYAFFAVKPDYDSEALDFRATSELLRRAFFDVQDDIDRRRETLISEIEGKLQQQRMQREIFFVRWKLK